MHRKVSELRWILGQAAKDEAVCASDKRSGSKIVGKPCEGKPHARFDEGLLGRCRAAPAAYST
jgi:hypothetical protein